jgi:bifunctional non-homologous end joining protein LigD
VALWIAHHLEVEEILAKTSGSKGLQLYRRIDGLSGDEANEAAHEIARAVERAYPDAVVSNMKKELRRNKVLIDWSQNSPAKTTVAVYSLRARNQPTVSTPVTWDEAVACAKDGTPESLRFQTTDVLERVARHGDLFAPLLLE